MKRIQVEIHGLQNDQSIPVLVWMLVRESYKKLADVTTRVESLFPNYRFENIRCFLDNTIVPLHEDIGILEDNEKVTVKSTVGRISLVSDASEVVTIKDEDPEVTTDISFTPAESTSSCQLAEEPDFNSNTINLIDNFLDDISSQNRKSVENVPGDEDEGSPVKDKDDGHVENHPPAKRLKLLRKSCTVDSISNTDFTDFDNRDAVSCESKREGECNVEKNPRVSIENLDTQADRIRPEDPIEERRLTLERDVCNTYRILEGGDQSKQQCGSCSKDTDDNDGVLCGGCGQWWHLQCVGLEAAGEEYKCMRCLQGGFDGRGQPTASPMLTAIMSGGVGISGRKLYKYR